MFRVYDKEGNEQSFEWLREKYGNMVFHNAGAGEKFRLLRIDETEGPAVITVRVLNKDGQPHASQPVANNWPDSSLPSLGDELKSRWKDKAIHQNVDENGYTGFGLGNGSYIRDLAQGGPHTIWVLSPSLPSDGISGIGMLGGTNHAGPLSLVFGIGTEEAVFDTLRDALVTTADKNQRIQFNKNAALQRVATSAGFVPNSPEFEVKFDKKTYIAQRCENLTSGEVRVYYCKKGDWNAVQYERR